MSKVNQYLLLLLALLTSTGSSAALPEFGTASESRYMRELKPPSGKAVIYIYQLRQDGKDVSPRIRLNNANIGRLVPGSFTVWKLSPGRLNLHVEGAEQSGVSITARAGKIYRFRLVVRQTPSGPVTQLALTPDYQHREMANTYWIKNPQLVTRLATAPAPAREPRPAATTRPRSADTTPAKTVVTKRTPEPAPARNVEETETDPSATPRISVTPGGYGLILKAGSLGLSKDRQTVLATDFAFDDSASSPFAFEIYYQDREGIAYGGEYLSYTANFTTIGLTDSHDVDVQIILANAKKYFRIRSPLQPFVGAGIGFASTDISGPTIAGSTSNIGYQLMAGVEYRRSNIGVYGEYKYLAAKTEDDNGEKIDVSGSGIFAGVVFHFD